MSQPSQNHKLVLECAGVHQAFGPKRVLFDVNLKVIRGQFVSLVGPSGCGKSTLLNAIVGTHPPKRGTITVYSGAHHEEGRPVEGPGRDRGIVYQHYSLYPFLTAEKNVALGLMLDETSIPFRLFRLGKWRRLRREHLQKAAEFLARLGLADAIHLYPHQMSGGMRQRVAIAQALIMKPEIVLLDEPFGALDEATREDLQQMLLALYHENAAAKKQGAKPPYTIFLVTHELNEAIYVGDRVLGLSQYWNWRAEGHDAQPGATILYDKPAPVFQPGELMDLKRLDEQREEIRRVVFSNAFEQAREGFATYWSDLESATAKH